MTKRILALLFAVLMVCSLTACTGGSSGAPTAQGDPLPAASGDVQSSNAAPDASQYEVTQPITIQFWHSLANETKAAAMAQIAEDFNRSQDLITVETGYMGSYSAIEEQFMAAMTAKSGVPALCVINYPKVPNYATNGVAEPLGPYMEAFGFETDDFVEGFMEPLYVDGELYSLPFAPTFSALYFNQDIADELELEIPKTWEDMKVWSKTIYEATGKPGYCLEVDSANQLNFVLLNTGADPLGDGTVSGLDDERLKAWVKDFKEQCDAGYMLALAGKESTATQNNAFMNGEIMAVQQSSSIIPEFVENSKVAVTATMPFIIETGYCTTAGATMFIPAVNDQNTKNAAWQFMQYLYNVKAKEWVIASGNYPLRKSLAEDPEVINAIFDKWPPYRDLLPQMDRVVAKNPTPYYESAMNVICNYITEIMTEGSDFDSTWARMKEETDNVLAGN